MEVGLYMLEKAILLLGILFVLTGVIQYGKRSQDWRGIATMFYKRIPMSISEFKWYRLGIGLCLFAVVMRFGLMIIFPVYTL
ncbi:hypothetical protein D8T49_09315 [Vibrio vulnificus]|uniref:hypothetical protein n=1 Tax=Vibrio vulnificus TaxID=672 RepID=UPI00102367FC|nr:hypothetical protein [Vibrio vulnificus]EIO3937006.1 hypothetical protein [Vibrio vulnificus]EJV9312602.1 hypothetical protein [Vibrio vulnificus]EKZ9054284.1 hypothetical protein [Vibrio vulnificus]MCU8187760.1 hypothetical protein [Vibrio vulnificus]MCU8198330.1 hypothetical protein [Vibrio vulnificus]